MKTHTNRLLSMLLAAMMIITSALPYTAYAGETENDALYYGAEGNGLQSQSTTGGAIISTTPSAVTAVKVTPPQTTVAKGGTLQFSAQVEGDSGPSQKVTWSIEGETVTSTSISGQGLLTVAGDEMAATLTVKATSVQDMGKYGEAQVTVTEPKDEPVTLNDNNLRLAVNAALKKPSDHVITVGDMESLTELDASNWGIKDLTGLYTAVNLEILDLSGNPLTANVTASTYSKVLDGIEALTKLKELDLSDCNLGINPTLASNNSIPNSIWQTGVNYLESLEKLDLSGNYFRSSFMFSSTKLTNLKELDISDNQLYGVYFFESSQPNLESIDITGNYIYFDESEDCYSYIMEFGVEKFVYDEMKNRADLYAVKVANAGSSKTYYAEEGKYEIDAGTVLGDNLTFSGHVFSSANTVKITVDGQKYTAGCLGSSGTSVSLSGLELGKEHEITFEVMHLSGDTRTYTLKFTTAALPSGSAGITDSNLQYAVCAKLGEDPATYGVTVEDMESLTGYFSVTGITNAEGIQYATGLTKSLSLAGTFESLPDLGGIDKITALTIDSPNIAVIPSLASQVNVKTLTIKNADSVTALPSVADITALTTLTLTGGGGLSLPEGLSGCADFKTLSVTSSEGFDFTGLDNTSAVKLTIDSVESFVLPASTKLETLEITGCGLTEVPEMVLDMTALKTLKLNDNNLTDIPDLSGLTSLADLVLASNAFTDIPENAAKLEKLATLGMSGNKIQKINTDLSGLKSIESLTMNECGLTELPDSLWTLSSLKTLSLYQNKLRRIDVSMAGLTSLTTLDLRINELAEFPAGIKDLPAIQTIKTAYNFFTDLPEELILTESSTELTALKSFNYGGRIKYNDNMTGPAEGTTAYKVAAAIKSVRGVGISLAQSGFFSELLTLDSSLGDITQIHDALNPTEIQDYTLTADEGATSITLTPTVMLSDSIITVNGTQVQSGGSIEIPLESGLNTISIVCYNPYIPNVYYSYTTTYNLEIYAGSGMGDDFPAEGKTYSIGMRVRRSGSDSYSMADSYFSHSATMTYDAGQDVFAVDVTTTKDSWITETDYKDAAGNYVDAERVAEDKDADTATYRMYVKDLEADLYISPYVVPMGYAPVCRIVFDTSSIIDITGEEEPDDKDGTYQVPLKIVQASNPNQLSMANDALDGPAKVTIEDGKSTVDITVKARIAGTIRGHLLKLWSYPGTELGDYENDIIPAEIIETYEDEGMDGSTGTFPRTFRIERPATEEESFYIRVSVDAMAGFDQDAKLVLDYANAVKEGDEPGDEPDPDKELVKTVEAAGGEASLGSGVASGLGDNDNIGIRFRDESNSDTLGLNVPASVIKKLFEGKDDWEFKIVKSETASEDVDAVKDILPERGEAAGMLDIDAQLVKAGENSVEVAGLSDRIKVTITLTPEQVTQLDSKAELKLYWYDKANSRLVDMNAVFDLDAGTVYFYTDHFSTYVIAGITAQSGDPGGGTGETEDGTYNLSYEALQESSSQKSMANQFIKERATVEISGSKIRVTLVWHGTTSSPEASDGIHMTSVKKLQYLSSSGDYKNVSKSLDKGEDKLEISFTVNSISSPVYMRVQADEMGPDWKVFRLVFDLDSMKSGEAKSIKGNTVAAEQYTIEAAAGEGGAITPSGDVKVDSGADKKFTVKANEGYEIKDVLVNGESVGAVEEYTFEDVSEDGSIEARFQSTGAVPVLPVFDDIAGHWAEKYIQIAVGKGLFSGTGENEFSPDIPVTRGMFVTVLGRLHGIDAGQYGENKFADVETGTYYAPYIAWASENSIVSGTGDGRFSPDAQITREEVAVIIDRYAKYAGLSVEAEPAAEEIGEKSGSLDAGKKYTIEASAMQESKETESMADQFLTEPAVISAEEDKIDVTMTWHGTEFITMDMLKELKLQGADGEFAEVDRSFDEKDNTLVINFETNTIEEASVFQVYVPEGMGEMRPRFRLVFDKSTLKEAEQEQASAEGFADAGSISSWSKDSVERMKNAGILSGKTGNLFDPKGTATRAEAATIFVKLKGWDK